MNSNTESLKVRDARTRVAIEFVPTIVVVNEDGEEEWIRDPYDPLLLEEMPLEESWALRLKRARSRRTP